MTTTRRLVIEPGEDGSPHVVSVPIIGWRIYDQPPPEPSVEEVSDEIRLLLADEGIVRPPLVTYDADGQPRLAWGVEELAEELVVALRRERRVRRSARRAREPKPQGPVEGPPTRKRTDVVEVEQQARDGRWREIAPGDAEEAASERLVIPRRIVNEIRLHAREVDAQTRGAESVGRIVFVGGHAREYRRLRNLHAEHGVPGKMRLHSSWRRVPDETNVIVHAHPRGGLGPSAGDLRWAANYPYRSPFGTYSLPLRRLGIWRLDGHGGVAEVEWSMVR